MGTQAKDRDSSQLAGSLLVVALDGPHLSSAERQMLQEMRPAGVTLFSRNFSKNISEIATLNRDIQRTGSQGDPPLFICVDQEGGRVSRLRGFTEIPDLGPPLKLFPGTDTQALGELSSYGQSLGKALRKIGINVNFAPVVDILTCADNTAIGDRVFALDGRAVSARAGAFLRGMQAAGIKGCLKHFPGQGDAPHDTHAVSTEIEGTREELLARELQPFIDLMPECPMIMASHCIYPALSRQPASLAPEILQDLLRQELNYKGLILSDDMNMGAIPQNPDQWQEKIVASIAAGADLVLVCQGFEKIRLAHQALQKWLESDLDAQRLVEKKVERILKLRQSLPVI